MIVCPKCGYDNELGRIFCHSCGNKLDLSKIKPPTEGAKMRRKIKRNATKTVRVTIEVVITVVLVTCIWLMCLAPDLKTEGNVAQADAAEQKRENLETLVEGNKPGTIVAGEDELNAFLASNGFEKKKKPGDGIEVLGEVVRVNLLRGAARVEFLGKIHFSSAFDKALYLSYQGVPAIEGGHFVFKPTGGWIGRLPIHPKLMELTGLFDHYMGTLLGGMAGDKQLLDKLTAIKIEPKSVSFIKDAPAK